MNAQIRKKKNFLERETKLNNLAKIFHRKLETLLIYITVPKKKQEKLFFDDFFNVEEVSAYINTVVEDEHRADGEGNHLPDRPSSGESLNLNADNEIKSSKDIFIKNLLIFLNNLIVLYFSKSNLIDVCINRRSFNKCGFYACDNVFLTPSNKGKYKIDPKSRNIYLREYYDLFCSARCMNYNLHLLKEIAKKEKDARGGKNGNIAKGGEEGRKNLKTKCQLIYIMFLTFFPIFKFHDINVLLNNLELVHIQNNRIFLKPGGEQGQAQVDGKDKGDAAHIDEKKAENGEDKVCTIRTLKNEVSQKTRQLRKTLFPVIVEKQEGCEDSEEEIAEKEIADKETTDKITEESTNGTSPNGKALSNHVVSNHPQGETSNGTDGNKVIILPLRESLRGYAEVKTEEDPTNEEGDSCPKREQGKDNNCKNVRFNEYIQTYEYVKDERVDVYSVARTSMEASHGGNAQGGDSPPSGGSILSDDPLSDEDDHRRKVHPGVSPEEGETSIEAESLEETNELAVTLHRANDEKMKEAMNAEAEGERNPSDGEMDQVYEQVRESIFTNRKHFFEDILGNTLFDSDKVIGFDYEAGEEKEKEKEKKKTEIVEENAAEQVEEAKEVEQTEENAAEQVEEAKEVEQTEENQPEQVEEAKEVEQTEEKQPERVEETKQAEQEKTEKDLRTCATQRMSEINLKHDREKKGRRIVLLSSPGGGGASMGIPQVNEDGGAPEDDEAEAIGGMSGVMGGQEDDASSYGDEETAPGAEEKDDAVPADDKKEDAVPVDGKKDDTGPDDAAAADGENQDTSSYASPGGGENEDASPHGDEDDANLQNLLTEKKKKISEQYDEVFNKFMPTFLFAGTDGESGGEECPIDPLQEKDESSDDEEQVQQVKGQNKYTYSTEKCSAYEDMSLYVVLWDILTGIISKYTVYYFERSEFIIPKCPTEVERDRKNEFLRNVSQHMPRTIHPIAPTVFNVCQTFSFGKPLLPFKKIVYESIIYVIATALGRHKVEFIPSGEMGNIRKAEEFLTLENGMDGQELDELAMLFYQHFYY
ncbi:hypothetical protein C922_02758 [Plasmodium inui San Antonio 1]|uniref:RNA polymerase II subunit B1 CTD phosphatase RPAP2 homolog n=1 Tax=Plasmodium inui San Antonio 1 TaxID=1237626 RepID=W7A6C4_9APIC|nr:hypothetical protein C922_02758 [Plasmodium inui San Antonio 1]EUD66773.1 hypothetical protein C922_02758 [Plasmodium inui San Antonio 1]